MIFRRRRDDKTEDKSDVVPFEEPDDVDELKTGGRRGPWDRSETKADEDDDGYLDFGGLVLKPAPGFEVRLQIDERSSAVTAVMLAGPDSGLELRAFAAPRSEGIWDDVRKDIAAEAARRGGTATEVDGEYGTEVKLVVPVKTSDGRNARQQSRVVGVEGPRWLLRGTFLGKSADQPDPEGVVETVFRDVIVVRGDGPMRPREMIPMRMPPEAQAAMEAKRVSADEADGSEPSQ